MVKLKKTNRDLIFLMLMGMTDSMLKSLSDRFNLIVEYIQIDLKRIDIKQAITDTDFLIKEVNEVMRVFGINKEKAEKALVSAFEAEAKKRKGR